MPRLKEINPELLEAIRQLYFWQYKEQDSFSSILYRLFQKADYGNLQRLRKGFPAHYMAWRLWSAHGSQDKFFEQWLGDEFGGEIT